MTLYEYSCKNIKISEILLKDINGFTIARKSVDRPFDGYGTFNNINGRPFKISCYVIFQNKIVEIVNLKNIEYTAATTKTTGTTPDGTVKGGYVKINGVWKKK